MPFSCDSSVLSQETQSWKCVNLMRHDNENSFERVYFWSKVVHIVSLKGKGIDQIKLPWGNGQSCFLANVPQDDNQRWKGDFE